jgi:hypothetical protein
MYDKYVLNNNLRFWDHMKFNLHEVRYRKFGLSSNVVERHPKIEPGKRFEEDIDDLSALLLIPDEIHRLVYNKLRGNFQFKLPTEHR